MRRRADVVASPRNKQYIEELHLRTIQRELGSASARGEQRPDSDVDLIVEVEPPTLGSVFGSESSLGRLLGRRTEAGPLDSINRRVRRNIEEDLIRVWPA